MPHQPSANASSATSERIFDLNLPEVEPGNEPLPHPEPSYELQWRHARFLIKSQPTDFWDRRLELMNPEPFVLD